MARIKRWAVYARNCNEFVAKYAVRFMSSMTAVYLFFGWALLPSVNKNWETLVFYISGGVIQLVALPLIMVGQRLEGKATEQRLKDDHEMLKQALKDLEDIKDLLNYRPC